MLANSGEVLRTYSHCSASSASRPLRRSSTLAVAAAPPAGAVGAGATSAGVDGGVVEGAAVFAPPEHATDVDIDKARLATSNLFIRVISDSSRLPPRSARRR